MYVDDCCHGRILLDRALDIRRWRLSTRSRRERQFGDAASGSMERSRGRVVDHGKRERALNMADNDTKAPGATPAGKTTRTKAKTAAKTVKKEAAKAKANAEQTLKYHAGKPSDQASGKARDSDRK